jgi:hypothetical protein
VVDCQFQGEDTLEEAISPAATAFLSGIASHIHVIKDAVAHTQRGEKVLFDVGGGPYQAA